MNVAALVGAAAALVVAAWFDTSVVADAQRQGASMFDPGPYAVGAVGAVAAGGACLLVGWLGVRSSAVVALLYVLVGGYVALSPWLTWTFAAQISNGTPPILPDIASAMSDLYFRTQGPLNFVPIIGGAMAVAGVVSFARPVRRRLSPVPSASAVPAPDAA
jgi:hypothetical protein